MRGTLNWNPWHDGFRKAGRGLETEAPLMTKGDSVIRQLGHQRDQRNTWAARDKTLCCRPPAGHGFPQAGSNGVHADQELGSCLTQQTLVDDTTRLTLQCSGTQFSQVKN